MTTVEAFRRSLSDAGPPAESDPALQALWWAGKGDWEAAHDRVQRCEGDPDCDLVHAYLHRVEGDPANASYWYRRAGRRAATVPLQEEWADIAAYLLSRVQGA